IKLGEQRRVQFAEPADDGLGAELEAAAAAGMAPRGGLGNQLQLLDVVAEAVEQRREVGLGVEDADGAAALPVPGAAAADAGGVGVRAVGKAGVEDLPDLEEPEGRVAAIGVAAD